MNVRTLDGVNIGLLLISLAVAYILPFGAFVAAYAILGPLHYLTEINWLHTKNYFTSNNSWLQVSMAAATLVTLPKILIYLGLSEQGILESTTVFLNSISNGILFLGIWSAVVLMFSAAVKWRVLILSLGAILAYLLNDLPAYILIIGALLPTVLHVYVFTGLFMLYGAFKNRSLLGHFSVLLLALVPLVIAFAPTDMVLLETSEFVKSIFMENRFYSVNLEVGKLLGLADGQSFYFYGPWERKVQIFIAFAYIYHYLNWFSKTSIIGWHKGLKGKRAFAILAIWLTIVSLFVFDYRLGFMAALTLSFWHVFAEFPLNALSVKGISQHIRDSLLE